MASKKIDTVDVTFSLVHWLRAMDGGQVESELTREFKLFVQQLNERVSASEGKVAGTFTLSFDVVLDPAGILTLSTNMNTKLPKKVIHEQPFWFARDGITDKDTHQNDIARCFAGDVIEA